MGVTVKNLKQPHKKRKLPLLIPLMLLALLCIGAVELFVCSYQDPELYARITAPVRAGIHRLSVAGQNTWDSLSTAVVNLGRSAAEAADDAAVRFQAFLESLMPDSEEDNEDVQLVDDEAVAPPPRPQADYAITALESRDGLDYLTGGAREMVYYDQTSERWAEVSYGTDDLGGYGCGPTAMAMVISTLTEENIDPAQMAEYCVDHGYWAKKHGSYWSIVPGVAEDFGLTCTGLPPEEADVDTVTRHLVTGNLIVALMGPGHFTNGGHFIILRGVTQDGSILVADPASQERSLTTWELDLLLDELSTRRHNGGPLWTVSPNFAP